MVAWPSAGARLVLASRTTMRGSTPTCCKVSRYGELYKFDALHGECACLTHNHARQYAYVLQSLTLWCASDQRLC